MIIDVSSYQGKIDWQKVSHQDVTRVILRSTVKNGNLDGRLLENYNGILQNMNEVLKAIDFYKFSYCRDYTGARMECKKTLEELKKHGIRLDVMDYFFLDLEAWGGRDYFTHEANEVIMAYLDECEKAGVILGLYSNYNYLKNIIDPVWHNIPLWYARYNSFMGDIRPFKAMFWQYTSKGHIEGIEGNVDISREV